jgi:hypothetical protein
MTRSRDIDLRKLLEGQNHYEDVGGEGFDEEDWNRLCEELTDLMVGGIEWRVVVENFGWQKISGEFFVKASTGADLLLKVLPDTECTFVIYDKGNKSHLLIQNYHHDQCEGTEWYELHKIREAE